MSPPPRTGVRLRGESFEFSFDGRRLPAQRGDTLASALLANRIRLVGRSIKYRRCRGLLSAGPEEPNALVTVGHAPFPVPNVPATQLELQRDMIVTSQNRWPTLGFDVASALQLGGGFLGAGFYYKTFFWPSWRFYEPLIRRLAGFGPAPADCDLGAPVVRHVDCDVLVAGAGAAGLAAARAAARAGARVILCERDSACGGELEFEGAMIEAQPAAAWVAAVVEEIIQRGGLVLTSTAVIADSQGCSIAVTQPGGLPAANTLYRIRARAVVSAMGSVERPIGFVDNDRPGVLLLGAAERFLARQGVLAGRRAVLFGNHDRLYAAARRLAAGGMDICAVVDVRTLEQARHATPLRRELERLGIECLLGHAVVRARGFREVSGAVVAALDAPNRQRTLSCDTILMSCGWSPAAHGVPSGVGVNTYSDAAVAFTAGPQPVSRALAGAANGIFALPETLADGHATGAAAARAAAALKDPGAVPQGHGDASPHAVAFWRAPCARSAEKRQFVDFQNDVTVADLRQALAEGFTDIEHVKRYTTLGVGTDQGRTSATVGAGILAELSARPIAAIGQFRLRPPYQPMPLKTLAGLRAGNSLRPERRTPLHDWHVRHGGRMEPMGLWLRPRCYPTDGLDVAASGVAEAGRVRTHGGVFDASTLGKFEVAGTDAAAFLDHLYLTRAGTLAIGRGKYMVNLREDGMVMDDGLAVRLAQHRFLVTASTGHAEHVLSHLEFHRDTAWSGRDVAIIDVTDAWAVIACSGPASRETVIDALGPDWQAAVSQLRHLHCAAGQWRGCALRVLRASFSGELAFELHCRPRVAEHLWQMLIDRGMTPYGMEAVDILRVEKGYLTGAELNGQTSPYDLGMDGLLKSGHACVGRELLDLPALHAPERPTLVGLRAADGRAAFAAGAQLTLPDELTHGRGHITSSVYSPALGEWIGLALLARAHAGVGTELIARDPLRAGNTPVRVTAAVHFDVAGERMKS